MNFEHLCEMDKIWENILKFLVKGYETFATTSS